MSKNPVLKQRKTATAGGWLTRDKRGVILWDKAAARTRLSRERSGLWRGPYVYERVWDADEFKTLYTGIPRKGRAVWVEIEIVV